MKKTRHFIIFYSGQVKVSWGAKNFAANVSITTPGGFPSRKGLELKLNALMRAEGHDPDVIYINQLLEVPEEDAADWNDVEIKTT